MVNLILFCFNENKKRAAAANAAILSRSKPMFCFWCLSVNAGRKKSRYPFG